MNKMKNAIESFKSDSIRQKNEFVNAMSHDLKSSSQRRKKKSKKENDTESLWDLWDTISKPIYAL